MPFAVAGVHTVPLGSGAEARHAASAPTLASATCTRSQKAKRVRALAQYRKRMAAARKAYFKKHKKAALRKAFVKKQQRKLKALKRAAACRVRTVPPPAPPTPSPPSPPTQPPSPPAPPPPPSDTTPPQLAAAEVNAASVALTLNEDLAAGPPPASAFSVSVDGLAWRVESVAIDGRRVVLQLGLAVVAAEVVEVTYTVPATSRLRDAAGNAVAGFTARPANATPATPAPPAEPGYSLSIPKPDFAEDRVNDWQPWVGEWGPKTDPYWLPTTGTLRGLIILVDFSDAPATRTVEFYRDYLSPPSQSYFRENSYGRLVLELQTLPRWHRMPKTAAEYAGQKWSSREQLTSFFQEATALVDSEVDFSTVDAVFVVGPESVAGTPLDLRLFRAWPGEGVVRDGRELRWAVLGGGGIDPRGPSRNLAAHHIVTHETGHFFRLPDLYDQTQRGTPEQFAWAGRWDLMADNRASAHFFTWHKWLLGWLDAQQLRGLTAPGSTEAELTPLERKGGLKAVIVPISPSVVYVIENRQRIGEDIELCDKGVLVWVVDGSRRNVDHNAVIQPARRSYNDACGAIFDAGFDIGDGEVSTFEDANVRMDVLAALPNGNYRIRVTRK